MYIDSNCLLNSLIALLFFFSKKKNTITKISKILLKYSHFMKPYLLKKPVFSNSLESIIHNKQQIAAVSILEKQYLQSEIRVYKEFQILRYFSFFFLSCFL